MFIASTASWRSASAAIWASMTWAASSRRAMVPIGPESPGATTATFTASAAAATPPSRAPTSANTAASSSTDAANARVPAWAASAAAPVHPLSSINRSAPDLVSGMEVVRVAAASNQVSEAPRISPASICWVRAWICSCGMDSKCSIALM
ncbi:hypothetical protein ACFVVM_25290 [Nocardia sp. NPDC058176]|uniref:hypothetical protein n=1 Tax=Nocardia sp. NPDC058176 TaxID=3346368 RepID=UPI0036DE9C73